MTTLSSSVVRLSDLFEEAGPEAGRALGPGPLPGQRIVVEARQLAAIARQFHVDWQPASPADRIVLERPGKPVAEQSVVAVVREALVAAGAPQECDVELPGFVAPLVPYDADPSSVVTQLQFDAPSGRFSGLLSVTAADMPTVTMRIAGRAVETIAIPVATHRLLPGDVLEYGDLRMDRVRAALVRTDVARSPAQAMGLAVRHQVAAGQPVPIADLTRPAAVQKNETVAMLLDTPGLSVSAQGQALTDGAVGEHIRVLNPVSRAVVEAEIVGQGQVRVAPASIPVAAAARLGRSADR